MVTDLVTELINGNAYGFGYGIFPDTVEVDSPCIKN